MCVYFQSSAVEKVHLDDHPHTCFDLHFTLCLCHNILWNNTLNCIYSFNTEMRPHNLLCITDDRWTTFLYIKHGTAGCNTDPHTTLWLPHVAMVTTSLSILITVSIWLQKTRKREISVMIAYFGYYEVCKQITHGQNAIKCYVTICNSLTPITIRFIIWFVAAE